MSVVESSSKAWCGPPRLQGAFDRGRIAQDLRSITNDRRNSGTGEWRLQDWSTYRRYGKVLRSSQAFKYREQELIERRQAT